MATSTSVNSSTRAFTATANAIAAYTVVKVDSAGLISVAGDNNTDNIIGVVTDAVEASSVGAVRLLGAGGTMSVLCGADAIAIGDAVYTDGAGLIGTDTSNHKVGIALEASSASGTFVEVVLQTA